MRLASDGGTFSRCTNPRACSLRSDRWTVETARPTREAIERSQGQAEALSRAQKSRAVTTRTSTGVSRGSAAMSWGNCAKGGALHPPGSARALRSRRHFIGGLPDQSSCSGRFADRSGANQEIRARWYLPYHRALQANLPIGYRGTSNLRAQDNLIPERRQTGHRERAQPRSGIHDEADDRLRKLFRQGINDPRGRSTSNGLRRGPVNLARPARSSRPRSTNSCGWP